MRVDEFSNSLYEELEGKLKEIETNVVNSFEILRNSSATILKFITRLKIYISTYHFVNKDEEINFFKNIKPKFLSKLIYFQRAFEIQSRLVPGPIAEVKSFYLKELNKISEYLNNNKEFFSYYRSNSSILDEIYFIRKEPDSWLLLNFEDYQTDLSFTTIYDYKLSKIIAYESLLVFIEESLNKLEKKNENQITANPASNHKMSWTGSKVSLVELLYALQSSGSFNNGTIDIKQLATNLENFFNVDLGNYYRIFQEIRIRKINRTTFLDQLKERLLKRMDDSDVNPKRYF